MNSWIENRIEKAGWGRFFIWLVIYVAYSVWAFLLPGPFRNTLESLGLTIEDVQTSGLPELTFGISSEMPERIISQMGAGVHDYALFQAIDIPYALLGVGFTAAGIALGIKRFNLGNTAVRYALLVPLIYLASELVENPLLAGMALGTFPMDGVVPLIQQSATSVKTAADGFNSFALVISIGASFLALITKPFRKKRAD